MSLSREAENKWGNVHEEAKIGDSQLCGSGELMRERQEVQTGRWESEERKGQLGD